MGFAQGTFASTSALVFLVPALVALALVVVVVSVGLRQRSRNREADQSERLLPGDTPERTYPSIPGNLGAAPAWMFEGAPFDPVVSFRRLPVEGNAAPIYLDALYEFSPNEMEGCVAPEERRTRGRALKERQARMTFLQQQDQATVWPRERKEAVVEYAGSFDRLLLAQQRPACIFEVPIGIDAARAPHAPAARFVATLVDWRAEAFLAEGQVKPVLDDLEMILRLSRDLRPQGTAMAQLVSTAIDMVTVRWPLQKLLAAPGLSLGDCERLMEMLLRHEREGANHFAECLPSEYALSVDSLNRLRSKEDIASKFGWPGLSFGEFHGKMAKMMGDESDVAGRIDAAVATMRDEDYDSEIEALRRNYAELAERARETKPWALDAVLLQSRRTLLETKLLRHFPDAFHLLAQVICGNGVWIGGAKCLVALRRWKFEHRDEFPPNLPALCKAAGLESVPIDTYCGEPMRSTLIDGEFAIISVGPAGRENPRSDRPIGECPGERVFRLPPLKVR